MAYPNYQIPTKLTFFPSYLQYAYATGQISDVFASYVVDLGEEVYDPQSTNQSDTIIKKEDIYALTNVNPSKTLKFGLYGGTQFSFKIPSNWNFDFGMILGHNFNNYARIHPTYYNNAFGAETDITASTIVNYTPTSGATPTGPYNGWSAFNVSNLPDNYEWIGVGNTSTGVTGTPFYEIGSIIYGKKWEAPQNIDITGSVSYSYGSKQKKTISGKTLSNMKYYKPQTWATGMNAWELTDEDEYSNVKAGRTGIRSWKVKWSMLAENKVLPQNAMQNSVGWTADSDSEYSTGADDSSLYDSENGIDFVTSVLKMTMGSHLPVVVRISESNNPDQWAIVRITKHSITQRNPKLLDVSLTLEEQV